MDTRKTLSVLKKQLKQANMIGRGTGDYRRRLQAAVDALEARKRFAPECCK